MRRRHRQLCDPSLLQFPITLMSPGDVSVLYSDGVYDGNDEQTRELLEVVMDEHLRESAKEICNALLDHAVKQDEQLRQNGEVDMIDDKTVFIVKRA